MPVQNMVEKELSTGLVIAGAYADKLRRTLFAQLRDLVKKNKEFAREVARAAGEINRLIYLVIVDRLKSDKGDVVRIRVKYVVDVEHLKINWKYRTLRIEYFKRFPDEEIKRVVESVLEEELEEVRKQYRGLPGEVGQGKVLKEEKVHGEGWEKEETIKIIGTTQPLEREEKVSSREDEGQSLIDLHDIVSGADPLGETLEGGAVFKITDPSGNNIGIASVEPHAGAYVIDCIIIHGGKAYRIRGKASRSPGEYIDDPSALLEEIGRIKPIPISKEDAQTLIKSKMGSLV